MAETADHGGDSAGDGAHQLHGLAVFVVHQRLTGGDYVALADIHLGDKAGEIIRNHRSALAVHSHGRLRLGGDSAGQRQVQTFFNLYFHIFSIESIVSMSRRQLMRPAGPKAPERHRHGILSRPRPLRIIVQR